MPASPASRAGGRPPIGTTPRGRVGSARLASCEKIASAVLLAAKRCDRELEYAVPVDVRVPNPMGKFIFVSELTSGRTDVGYCNEVFGEVFNKPKLWQLLDGIQHETSLTTEDIAEMVTGSKPSLTTCYKEIREKLYAVVDCISERRKITNKSIGIDAEPSPGLYGTLYFDLLAEEDAKMGVYVISTSRRTRSRRWRSRSTSSTPSRG